MVLEIDGSEGEGGGQILRSSLTMSAVLNRPVKIFNIRAGRREPGLQAQHLTCVRALAQICDAEVHNAVIGSQELTFIPKTLKPGEYRFDVSEVKSSAGSISLIFQTILLPLALCARMSKVVLRGGTHVPWSPTVSYLQDVYIPIVSRMGLNVKLVQKTWGWYPVGGGEAVAEIYPSKLTSIDLRRRGEQKKVKLLSVVSNLPISIAKRQLSQAEERLKSKGIKPECNILDAPSKSPGTFVFICAEFENSVAGFESLGSKGKRAEQVADEAFQSYIDFINSGTCADKHLADQLILLMALAKGRSSLTTEAISSHLITNVSVIEKFLPVRFNISGVRGAPGEVAVDGIGFNIDKNGGL